MKRLFNIYKVHKEKEPELLISKVGLITARKKVKSYGSDDKEYFYGFYDYNKKPNKRSSFRY